MPTVRYILRWHVWVMATALPLVVDLFSLKALLSALTPVPWCRPYMSVPPGAVVRIVQHRLRRPRNMRRRSCLRLSLTLFHFLRLAGVPAVLQIGAFPPSRDPRRLHAHCWVTVDGVPVAGAPAEPLAVLLTHPGPSTTWQAGAATPVDGRACCIR